MALPLVAGAIGGSTALNVGTSIWQGIMGADAADKASAAMQDAFFGARSTLENTQDKALGYLDPFRQFGLNAGAAIEDLLYSPSQRQAVLETQRQQLEGEVQRLKASMPDWNTFPIFSGDSASERRQAAFTQQQSTIQNQIRQAEAKLKQFDTQAKAMQGRIGQSGPTVQASPWYQFQAELLGRNMDRFFTARGLTGSGFEAEERRRGLLELGAGETERQFGRLFNLLGVGANTAGTGANAIVGTGQGIANAEIGAGQAKAQGILGQSEAWQNAIGGVSSAVNSGISTGLNYSMFQDLINRNKPVPTGTVR